MTFSVLMAIHLLLPPPTALSEKGPGFDAGPAPTSRMKTAGGPRVDLDPKGELPSLKREQEKWAERVGLLAAAVVQDPKPGRLRPILMELKTEQERARAELKALEKSSGEKERALEKRVRARFARMARLYDRIDAE